MEPMTELELAIRLATQYHKGQTDKGGKPYITHPLAVMQILLNGGCSNEEVLSVAVLHDVLEDCNVSTIDLQDQGVSGTGITALIALTKGKEEKYWDYIERVKVNYVARQVKLADLKHNSELERLYETGDEDFVSIAGRYAKAYYILRDWEDNHVKEKIGGGTICKV